MKYADLHIHSSYSDGYLSPEEIVNLAKKKGIKCISITDHDTIVSQYICKEQYDGINIIPGIEFSTEFNGMEIHILGYFLDINNSNLINAVNRLRESRIERTREILRKLKELNINIDIEEVTIDMSSSIGEI